MGRHRIALGTRRVASIYIGQAHTTPSAAKGATKRKRSFFEVEREREQITDCKEVEEGWEREEE